MKKDIILKIINVRPVKWDVQVVQAPSVILVKATGNFLMELVSVKIAIITFKVEFLVSNVV